MEGVKTFLESSSIHGLTYISTTRKFVKIFWILVVFWGFTFAGYMINNSISSWAERPIKTTLETRPISEITLPKVTVCPPKNTFTDLNHDLMLAEKNTLTDEMRIDFTNHAEKLVDDHAFMNDIDELQEEDRYYNWYHGYTKMGPSSTDKGTVLSTSATSGVVTTQYYGEQYNPNLVRKICRYGIYVYPPESFRNNTNVTLHFHLEKVSLTGLSDGFDHMLVNGKWCAPSINCGEILSNGQKSGTFIFNPPVAETKHRYIRLFRNYISKEDLFKNKMKLMPGFRFRWYYTGLENQGMMPDRRYDNKEFRRYSFKRELEGALHLRRAHKLKKEL